MLKKGTALKPGQIKTALFVIAFVGAAFLMSRGEDETEAKIREAAAQLNAKKGTKIGASTIKSVTSSGRTIIYTFIADEGMLLFNWKEQQRKFLDNQAKNKNKFRQFRDLGGGKMTYVYEDSSGKELFRHTIDLKK